MDITLSEYLKEVFTRRLHLLRSWRLQAFAIKETYLETPYFPVPTASGMGFHNDDGELIGISEVPKAAALKPILPHYTEFEINKDHFLSVRKSERTSIGIALINYITIEPYGNRYPYVNKVMESKDILDNYIRDISSGNTDDEFNAHFIDIISDIETLLSSDSEFILRSIVEGQFIPDKAHDALRARLIEENKDNLDDPLVTAKIEDAIAKSSAERYKRIGATIWDNGKSHKSTLMKTEGNYGSETEITGGRSKYVIKSLREGIELDKIGDHVGVARYGSHGRGALTALGGAAVNDAYQALESKKSTINDCGTTGGRLKRIREHNYKLFLGQALAGTSVYLTEAMLKNYIGKSIIIRLPSTCKAKKDDTCKLCGGKDIARLPTSIPTKATGLMSTVMDVFMQATHTSASRIIEIDFFDDIY